MSLGDDHSLNSLNYGEMCKLLHKKTILCPEYYKYTYNNC